MESGLDFFVKLKENDKSHLPEALKILDEGHLTFVKKEFLNFIREADLNIREYVTLFAKTRHKKFQRLERSTLQRSTNALHLCHRALTTRCVSLSVLLNALLFIINALLNGSLLSCSTLQHIAQRFELRFQGKKCVVQRFINN